MAMETELRGGHSDKVAGPMNPRPGCRIIWQHMVGGP